MTASVADKIHKGDVLVAAWGYGQINIDYYVVLKRTPHMVDLQRVQTQIVDSSSGVLTYDEVLPNTHVTVNEPFRRKVSVDERTGKERVVLERWVGAPIARLWDGERNRQTSTAYMH